MDDIVLLFIVTSFVVFIFFVMFLNYIYIRYFNYNVFLIRNSTYENEYIDDEQSIITYY